LGTPDAIPHYRHDKLTIIMLGSIIFIYGGVYLYNYAQKRDIIKKLEKRANRKGIPFNLDIGWLSSKLALGFCESTGLPFKEHPNVGHRNPYLPSVDRIDSSGGYTKDNCRLVVMGFNVLKSNFDDDTLTQFCKCFCEIYEEKNK